MISSKNLDRALVAGWIIASVKALEEIRDRHDWKETHASINFPSVKKCKECGRDWPCETFSLARNALDR